MQTATAKVTAYKDPKLPAGPTAPDGPDWTNVLKTIRPADALTLLAAIETLYPHDSLNPLIYRRVILQFDHVATANPEAAETLTAFCTSLQTALPLPFADLAESYRIQALKSIEGEKSFFFLQRLAIRYLYDDVELWAAFGYEGASVHLGGYLKRGFDDLDWLPPLPNEI